MSRLSRLMHYLNPSSGADMMFENYYGSLVRERQVGVPSAAEARRDFEVVRRMMDKAVIY